MKIKLRINVSKGAIDGKITCSTSWTKPLVDDTLGFDFNKIVPKILSKKL